MKFLHLSLCATVLLLPVFARAQSVEPKNTVITSDGPCEMVSTEKETTILGNLLANAVKYSPAGSTVRVFGVSTPDDVITS